MTFIFSWRVLSTTLGPYQVLNPKWIITKQQNYRGQNFHFFTHYLTWLLLPPFGTKPLRAERNNNSSRVLFWMMDDRPKAGTQDVELWIPANPQHTDKIPSFKPWSGATSPPSGGHGDDERPQAGCMLLLNQPAGLPSCLSLHQGLLLPRSIL